MFVRMTQPSSKTHDTTGLARDRCFAKRLTVPAFLFFDPVLFMLGERPLPLLHHYYEQLKQSRISRKLTMPHSFLEPNDSGAWK